MPSISISRMFLRIFAVLLFLFVCKTVAAQDGAKHDSLVVSIAPEYDSVTKFHRFLFGEGYRKLWAVPVKMRVLNLATEKGGMKIEKTGGGLQTKSLRLKDASGREWVLRTIQKYPERGLPEDLRAGLAKDILQDQIITSHPYGSVTVPPLASALDIPHANPEIVYVPDDPALGEYRKEFGNAVFVLEEREPGGVTDNTAKAQHELEKDNDARLEQKLVLRARLLDMVLGDWDRHEDQWRWAKQESGNNKTYRPVPRDRDKVYYSTSGLLPWVISHQWLKSNLQPYQETIRDIKGYNFNNRYFDRYFLTALDEADWKEELGYVREKLTDSLLNAALRLLPDTIYALTGRHLTETIIARRNNLEATAMEYYRFISKYVDIPASEKNELVQFFNDSSGSLTVKINKIKKDGMTGHTMYLRSFDPAVTKEIRVYGFAGNDVYTINTNKPSPIKVRLIGGSDKDSFSTGPLYTGKTKFLIYDGKTEPNSFSSLHDVKFRLSDDINIHAFDKKAFKYDRLNTVFFTNYSIDEGFSLIGGFANRVHGFRKEPYAFYNELLVNYSMGRRTFLITWMAQFKELVGKNDLGINLYSRGPQSQNNFFGLGNESVFENEGNKTISYYRSRYDYINLDVRLYRSVAPRWRLSAGLATQYYTSSEENNKDLFFDKYNSEHPASLVYEEKMYAGIIAAVELDTRNNWMQPTRGMYWNTTLKSMHETTGDKVNYGGLLSELNLYLSPLKKSAFVIATRFGAGTTVGSPSFFQQMYLGGKTLRGFHTNRFGGKTVLYNNLELRMKLFDFRGYLLPGSVGLIVFNDIGRVWVPGESSSKWHDGYGTGIYIVPAQLLLIHAVAGFSTEGILPYVSIGFRF